MANQRKGEKKRKPDKHRIKGKGEKENKNKEKQNKGKRRKGVKRLEKEALEDPQGDDSARTMVVMPLFHVYCRIAKRLFLLFHEPAQQLDQSRSDAQSAVEY